MWETQGPMGDRPNERLATSDKGIQMLRDLMFAEIAKVQRGEDPMGVYRDPDHTIIDTNLQKSATMEYPTGTHTPLVDWRAPGVDPAVVAGGWR